MTMKTRADFPEDAPGGDVHYRLYRRASDERVVVACVQWFDYPDYSEDRFVTEEAFESEAEALLAAEDLVGGFRPALRAAAQEHADRPGAKSRYDFPEDAPGGDVHYRLYLPSEDAHAPVAICVQWFDYFDYAAHRLVSDEAFGTEAEAEAAIDEIMTAAMLAAD